MGEPFVLEGPGELEMGGIFIDGLQSFHDKKRGQSRGENTIFLIKSEEIKCCLSFRRFRRATIKRRIFRKSWRS